MPIIGSISGAFGYGRSPQTAPLPGFLIYPPIGRTTTWLFATNGAFDFESNAISGGGNCFVITPTTTFVANVAVWGAGGGSPELASFGTYPNTNVAGAGGAVYGSMVFQSGQPYTVFAGSAGFTANFHSGGGGGAASGILLGNVFLPIMTANMPLLAQPGEGPSVAFAGGGGGASTIVAGANANMIWSGAGGGTGQTGTSNAPVGTWGSLSPFVGDDGYGGDLSKKRQDQSGLPAPVAVWYAGGTRWYGAGKGPGGGGGGGGNIESGGPGYVKPDQVDLQTVGGSYAIPALYDNSRRGLAGDSDRGGRVSVYLDEYQLANISATGGTVTDVPIPGYELAHRYHTFTSGGKFTVNSASITDTVDIFAVGGGGGGGGGSTDPQYQVNFNGASQYLTTPAGGNYNINGDFTVECWVYMTATGKNPLLTVGIPRTQLNYGFAINSNSTVSWWSNPANNWRISNSYTTTAEIQLRTWTHLAAVNNGGTFVIYINGTSVYSTDSFAQPTSAGGTLYIATYFADANNDGSFFKGSITNFRIVKGTAVYTSAFTTPVNALTAIANTVLLTCKSASFVDLSVNPVTITPVNSPTISVSTLSLINLNDRSAGGGGGGVAIRTRFAIGAGNYLVEVGSGGSSADAYSTVRIGGVWGGYRGRDSAFYTNPLAAKLMPDSYWRLINSFGAKIRYISPSGDDTDGLTQQTAYSTLESAISKNSADATLIVFAVLAGTYTPVISDGLLQTAIYDGGQPRIFVCVPAKVIINFTPVSIVNRKRAAPMAQLSNSFSAIYGATFVRNMFDATTDSSQSAFFSNYGDDVYNNGAEGNFYNCAFKENLGKWALVFDGAALAGFNQYARMSCKVENCTFVTKIDGQDISGSPSYSINGTPNYLSTGWLVLFKSCVFNKNVITDAVMDSCLTGATVSSKYVTTGVTDKGVFAGEFGWGTPVTVPEKTAKIFTMVAQGGGGANNQISNSPVRPNSIGGSGGGVPYNVYQQAPSTQYNSLLNFDYSSYGFPGGKGSQATGGGGAGHPGVNSTNRNSPGGIGIEWPRNSGIYYGTGGNAFNAVGPSDIVAGSVGRGGHGGTVLDVNGYPGTVMIRYVVPGPYTPVLPPVKYNLIAFGGIVTQTATYKQHLFLSSEELIIQYVPEGMYVDVLVVGGGGGGGGRSYNFNNQVNTGGDGGGVDYYRFQNLQLGKLVVVVGAGGAAGSSFDAGFNGVSSSIKFRYETIIGGGGQRGYPDTYSNPYGEDGKLIINGLFSDNTVRYGAGGGAGSNNGRYPNGLGWGQLGSGGLGGNDNSRASAGYSGIVIVRYPILPQSN